MSTTSRLDRVQARMGPDLRNGIERMPGLGGIALYVTFADTDEPNEIAYTDGRSITAGPRYTTFDEAERHFIILHEVLHVGLAHPARERELEKLHADFDHKIYNIAADGIINASLKGVRGIRQPKNSVDLEELLKFLELWPENRTLSEVVRLWSSEALYFALMRKRDEVLASAFAAACPSDICSGEGKQPGEGDVRDNSPALDELMRTWRSRLLMARGSLSGVLSRLAKELPAVKTPWDRILRDYLFRNARKKREPDPSRPSRRWLALEHTMRTRERVDLPFERGMRPVRSARLAFGVDTSGSIDDQVLRRFAAEMCSAITSLDPVVRMIVCDAAVHQTYDLSGPEAVNFLRHLKFKGGGGTDFRPAIEAAAEWRPDCMVYLTDLEGEAGSQPRFPVLWAVPPGHAAPPWGRCVELL